MEPMKVESVSALFAQMEGKKVAAEKKRDRLKREMDQLMDEADALAAKAMSKRREAKDLYEQIGALDYGNWVSDVIWPLADELARRAGKKAQVFGPCGIGAKVVISLVDDLEKRSYEQDSLELTLEPEHQDGRWEIRYETGERTDLYEPGTVGFINGLNNVTAPLPDSVGEILALFRMYPAVPINRDGEQGET